MPGVLTFLSLVMAASTPDPMFYPEERCRTHRYSPPHAFRSRRGVGDAVSDGVGDP